MFPEFVLPELKLPEFTFPELVTLPGVLVLETEETAQVVASRRTGLQPEGGALKTEKTSPDVRAQKAAVPAVNSMLAH